MTWGRLSEVTAANKREEWDDGECVCVRKICDDDGQREAQLRVRLWPGNTSNASWSSESFMNL